MNRTLAEVTALPLYAQVAVQDAGTIDLPQWETGDERAVASEHAVVVATRPDTDGDVVIRVLEGGDTAKLGELVFEGELSVPSSALEVGNAVAATVSRVELERAGYWAIKIFVEPAELPSTVTVLLDSAPVA